MVETKVQPGSSQTADSSDEEKNEEEKIEARPANKFLCNPCEENNKHQEEIEKILRRLHLKDQHQRMLSSEDFIKIGPPVNQTNQILEKEIVFTFLQRLMMLDYRARYITNQSKEDHIHPMDVQMAIFHCSDSFLRQKMITKLSQCQYALPLLFPDPVTANIVSPLWTFRQISKSWKICTKKEDSSTVKMKSMPIYKAKTPLVSFFRLASLPVSKSQLMNTLINDRHNTFFHRDCPGSTKSHNFMDGVAEIAWYCPAGKSNDFFNDCVAFCNLHGDSLEMVKQREILTKKSSVIIILVQTLEMSQESKAIISMLLKSSKPLIILSADNDCSAVEVTPQKYKLGLKERSQSDVSKELKEMIRKILSGPHKLFQLKTMEKMTNEVRVDEEAEACQNGKTAAMKLVALIRKMDIAKIKEVFLPCQGPLWYEWCKINKELYHLKGEIEQEKAHKTQQLMELRQKQCDVSNSELMKLFTESLKSLPTNEYFLKWTQILIDAVSTDYLSSILQKYDETWSEVLALKKKDNKSEELIKKQAELEQLSKLIQSATFGLEHMFREMGQIYEAHKSLEKPAEGQQAEWTKYPELAADLMIKGHPMELMDGDAGHVPLIWISSLIQEVIKKLGDQRVFVLSVLGLQSSGKSTMLNAMFGLEFAVSAGRCTKGAYMQLVKLSEEIQKDYRFDYILVVDTEGLRALELAGNATLHHDNELATFVVGLGNLTLINIFGENPAHMQDILQIVVQAFMRMKKVKLSSSCVFVHQNVTDIAAAEKNMDGKRRLQEKLDAMTQLAAEEEGCAFECFSDVIAFNVQEDVKYFAQLWEGSPPMAPPNPGYSESVQELKASILSKASDSDGILLSHFGTKIQDLWNALINEHFVFSFKNTQEIAVYRELEVQYGNWTWALRSEMLNVENQLYTKVEKGQLGKVELTDLSKEISNKYEEVMKKMTAYFNDNQNKEMLVQWQGRFENKIKGFHDDIVRDVKRKLNEVIQQKNARTKLDDKKGVFENKLLQQSKELAHKLKCLQKYEEEKKAQFNNVWSHWVKELTLDTKPIENIYLEKDQFNILLDLGVEPKLIHDSKKSQRYKNLSETLDYSDYITAKENSGGAMEKFKRLSVFNEQKHVRSFIKEVEKKCLDALKSKPVATRGYTSTYLSDMAQIIIKHIKAFESGRDYVFKKEFTVDLSLFVFGNAESWLLNSHKTYKDNNDVHTYLETKKNEYYSIFQSYCKGSSSAVVFGETMCKNLKASAVAAVCNKTAVNIASEIKGRVPAFNGNRVNLEKYLLKNMAEKEDFKSFITYIRDPRKQLEAFIKEEVKKNMFKNSEAQKIIRKNVEDIRRAIGQALFEATEDAEKKKGDIEMWVKEFSTKVGPILTIDTISCENFKDINNFDFLKEEMEKGLKIITEEMINLSLNEVNKCRQRPEQILIDQLCNCCWETCPFCAAVCTNTIMDHSPDKHSALFHRPAGIIGRCNIGTDELTVELCTTAVASDGSFYPECDSESPVLYKEYPTAGERYAAWSITPDGSMLPYWKWFVCHFQEELEKHYKMKFHGRGEIPQQWKLISKKDAIDSLDRM
ncbi:interferon-induced very large GTPase 1-like [Cyprinodon tularosa]|uniref:interferon-induced very large GTPase 1-like n=1 Tax=Cyprinodon tularosa TaxID=77115 RepID=UPI0018E286EF|nr:interferon-induced very large GTPase 1-like [Cyprinodon tularosa]